MSTYLEPRLYFCRDGQTVEGPFDASVVRQMVSRRELSIVTQVCQEGTESWIPFDDLPKPLRALKKVVTWIGVILIAFLAVGFVIYSFVDAADKQKKALDEMANAANKADQEIKDQISAVHTLTEKHDTMAAAMQRVIDIQNELSDLQQKAGKKAGETPVIKVKRNELEAAKATMDQAGKIGDHFWTP